MADTVEQSLNVELVVHDALIVADELEAFCRNEATLPAICENLDALTHALDALCRIVAFARAVEASVSRDGRHATH